MTPIPGNWQNLPHHVFGDIMTIMGRESIQDFQKCREVCQSWNVMMSQMTKYEKDTIRRKAASLADQVRKKRCVCVSASACQNERSHLHFHPEIITLASLAYHCLLGTVESMELDDVDLGSVPVEHLASLVSCVTRFFNIRSVSNCDLVSLLDSVKTEQLSINNQRLSCEETQAVVRAMETRVERVLLGGEESLDITALTQYSGQGKCGQLTCWDDTAHRYGEEVKTWARRINWTVAVDNIHWILMWWH